MKNRDHKQICDIYRIKKTIFPLIAFILFSSYYPLAGKLKRQENLREEIPIVINYDHNTVTPVIQLSIDDKPYNALFDTGSWGLRILNGALVSQGADSTSKDRVTYTYGEGQRALFIAGKVKAARISLGRLISPAPVRFMSIDGVKYGSEGLWAPARASALIQSNHFRGLSAIIGVGLRLKPTSKGVANPLAQLPGNGKFIIRFPRYGGQKGKLILNPITEDESGFTYFYLTPGTVKLPGGYSSWLDDELLGCLVCNGSSACQNTLLDTGSSDTQIFSAGFQGSQLISSGTFATMEILDKSNASVNVKNSFRISPHREAGKDFIYLKETKSVGRNVFGTIGFFEFDVLYDQKLGIIGLKRK